MVELPKRDRAAAGQLKGEATPIYLYWPEIAPQLARYNPQLKLIVILRDPVARAIFGNYTTMVLVDGMSPEDAYAEVLGEVLSLEGNGANQKAEIRFASVGVKKLLLQFAKLTIIS